MSVIKTIVKIVLAVGFFILIGLVYISLPAADQPAFLQLLTVAIVIYYVIDWLVGKLKNKRAYKTCGRCLGSGVGTAVNDFGRCSKCDGTGKIEVQDKSPMGILLCLTGIGIVILGVSSLGWASIAAGVALVLLGIMLVTDKYMYSDWR
jgi:hypothetical protein